MKVSALGSMVTTHWGKIRHVERREVRGYPSSLPGTGYKLIPSSEKLTGVVGGQNLDRETSSHLRLSNPRRHPAASRSPSEYEQSFLSKDISALGVTL